MIITRTIIMTTTIINIITIMIILIMIIITIRVNTILVLVDSCSRSGFYIFLNLVNRQRLIMISDTVKGPQFEETTTPS